MTTEEWQNLVQILERISNQFKEENRTYQNASNQKNRKEAYRLLSNTMKLAKYHVGKHEEALRLLWNDSDDEMYRAEVNNDFQNEEFFDDLITKLIKDIKEKKIINSNL